ncbi:MAG: hypothetical protein K2M95_02850 [Clostridiales bacterium]|nr:hypothetical protein [Clostridiales bacterium]
MSKFKKSVLIFGALILMTAVALGTFLVLSSMDMIAADPIAVEFTVLDGKKVYDGKPLEADWYYITSGELMKGHSAVVSYSGSITEVGEAESDMTVRIKDEKGYDVTDKYAIKVVGGKLTVTMNELTIKLPDTEVTYSGERVEFNTIEVLSGKLGTGHKIVLEAEGGLNVGDRLSFDDEDLKVYDAVGNDVSRNYSIDCEKSNLTILPRPVTFAPVGGVVKVYDGMPVSIGRYEIVSGSLAPGQYASVSVSAARRYGDVTADMPAGTTEVAAWGKYELSVDKTDVTIYDKDGNDVTDNYTVSCNVQTVEIQRRPLALGVKEVRKTYDGVASTPTVEITDGTVASYQTLTAARSILLDETNEAVGALLRAGAYRAQVDIASVQITDREGANVTENYLIDCPESVSVVERRALTLSVRSLRKTYDAGMDRPTADVTDGSLASKQALYLGGLTYVLRRADEAATTPVPADGIVLDAASYSVSVNRGSVKIIPSDTAFDAADEAENFAANYEITLKSAEYTIERRTVYVVGLGQSFTYDGDAHACTLEDNQKYTDSSFVDGHSAVLTYTKDAEVTNVGDEEDNEFTYIVVIDASAAEVTQNYLVIPTYGKLTVTPMAVTLKGEGLSVTYGDTPVFDYRNITVVTDDETNAELTVTLSKVKIESVAYDYENATAVVYVEAPKFVNEAGEDVTQNYVLSADANIEYEITKRTVKLAVGSGTIDMDMVDIFLSGGWRQYVTVNTSTPLAAGDTLDLTDISRSNGLRYSDDDGGLFIRIADIHIVRDGERIDGKFYEITSDSILPFPSGGGDAIYGFFPVVDAA